jgi:hypothetical protein
MLYIHLRFIYLLTFILGCQPTVLYVHNITKNYDEASKLCEGKLLVITEDFNSTLLGEHAPNKTVWLDGKLNPLNNIINYDDLTTSPHYVNMFSNTLNDFTNDSSFTIAFETWKRLYDYDWSIIEYETETEDLNSVLLKYRDSDNPSTSQFFLLYDIQNHIEKNEVRIVLNTTDNYWYIVSGKTNHTVVCIRRVNIYNNSMLIQYSSSLMNLLNLDITIFVVIILSFFVLAYNMI